jgi:hypothetical protein
LSACLRAKRFGWLTPLLGATRSTREVDVHDVDQGEGCNQIGNAYADVSQHGAPLTSNLDLLQSHMACTDRKDGEHESTTEDTARHGYNDKNDRED